MDWTVILPLIMTLLGGGGLWGGYKIWQEYKIRNKVINQKIQEHIIERQSKWNNDLENLIDKLKAAIETWEIAKIDWDLQRGTLLSEIKHEQDVSRIEREEARLQQVNLVLKLKSLEEREQDCLEREKTILKQISDLKDRMWRQESKSE